MSGAGERKKGIQIHRSVVYGTSARLLSPEERALAPENHTHRWTIFFQSAATPPPGGASRKRKRSTSAAPHTAATAAAASEGPPDASELHDEDPDFITGGADDLSWLIKRVTFKLHDTYANPNRSIDKPPYAVTETGWGEFQIGIKVFFQPETNERSISLSHGLKLHHWGPEASGPEASAVPALLSSSTTATVEAEASQAATPRSSSVAAATTAQARQGSRGVSETPGAAAAASQAGTPAPAVASSTPAPVSVPTTAPLQVQPTEAAAAAPTPAPESGAPVSELAPKPSSAAAIEPPAAINDPAVKNESPVTPAANAEDAPVKIEKDEDGDADGEMDAEGEADEEDAEGEPDVDGTPAGSIAGAGETNEEEGGNVGGGGGETDAGADVAMTGRPANALAQENITNILPVHSWQYDEIIFTDPTQGFYDLLLAHPPTPLPAYSLRRTIPEGEGAIPGVDRGSAGVPMEFTLALEKGEADKLESVRKLVIEEMDRHRQRLIELEREQQQLKEELDAIA